MLRCNIMTPKELHDGLAQHAELAFNSFNARRENEWKISVSLWGLIVVTTNALLKTPVRLRYSLPIAALIVLMHASFITGVWLKNSYDEEVSYYLRQKCTEVLTGEAISLEHMPGRRTWRKISQMRTSGSSLFQLGATVLLTVICALILRSH